MSTRLLDLEDRVITDSGLMVPKHNLLVRMALNGEPISHLPFVPHPDTILYHQRRKSGKSAKMWKDTEEISGPTDATYNWHIPEPYASLDITELCEAAILDMQLETEAYLDRLANELIQIEEKQMQDFLRCLVWITQTFREKKVVWGLGRGSSCASLVLFLLGVNKVDPVLYDIPMEEFYK